MHSMREKAARALYDWDWETGFAPYEKVRPLYQSHINIVAPFLRLEVLQEQLDRVRAEMIHPRDQERQYMIRDLERQVENARKALEP